MNSNRLDLNLLRVFTAILETRSVLPLPVDIPKFQVKQHWHERFHQDPGNRWLRGEVVALFQDMRVHQTAAVSRAAAE
ncbi:MAG: hypothetical protein KIT16_06645 [Rhodospirillaceae bacterium]|nr:hypothetical protein [Rhodospirillaceae bacterium]